MSSIFARGHRICRSTRFRPPQIHATSRRHLQLDIMPVSPESSTSLEAFQEPLLELPPSRLVRFNALIEFVQGGLGAKSKRAVPSRGIRSTSWNKLFMFAETAEQLEKVAEMFPKWRDMQRSFSIKASELFVRRCEELCCPLLALRVFSNHPKYAFLLSSQLAALQLLHSLHLSQPLQETITASALFKVNNLPPATSSLPACAMLVSACFHAHTRSKDPRARELADSLLPVLQGLCADTPANIAEKPRHSMGVMFEEKPKIWTVAALRKIKKALNKEGKGNEYKWIERALRKFDTSNVETRLLALGAPEMLALAAPALAETGQEVVAFA